jgi:hypothetical protein
MNRKQAAALQTLIERRHPDAGTTVTAEPGGAAVSIEGPLATPGLSGPGGATSVELRLGRNSPFLVFFLAARLREANDGS